MAAPQVRSDHVIARMIRAVNLTARPFTRELARQYGLSLAEWRCLRVFADTEQRGSGGSAREVADQTGLDKMSTSRAINSLERKGLITRERCTADKRSLVIGLTARGRELVTTLLPAATARTDLMLRRLSANERAQLAHLLDQVIGAVGEESD